MNRFNDRVMVNDGKDLFGKELKVGQTVAKSTSIGRSSTIEIRKVVKVDDGKVYLDGHKLTALQYSGRVLIINDTE